MRTFQTYEDIVVLVNGTGELSSLNIEDVRSAFRRSGAALFRGFDPGVEQFRTFSNSVSSEIITHVNFSRRPHGDRTVTSVSPGNGHLFAHSEMGYLPFRSDIAWFYCEKPASKGGETTVFDGVKVLKRLNPDVRRLFESKKLQFVASLPSSVWSTMFPERASLITYLAQFDHRTFSYEFDASNWLRTKFVISAITKARDCEDLAFCNSLLDGTPVTFEDNTPIPGDVVHHIIATTEQLAVPIQWQAGDVLMLDNLRFMHGRREFKDQTREILVRFSNIRF